MKTKFNPFPIQGMNDGNQPQYRVPYSVPAGGVPETPAGYKSHSITLTNQIFNIPGTTNNYAVDSGDADNNGNFGDIVLANVVPFGRFLFVPASWSIGITTSQNSKAVVDLSFISLTALMRRISSGTVLWAYSSSAPAVAQFYAGIDIPLMEYVSDFMVGIDPATDNFNDIELSYSAVFSNSDASPHAASIYGTLMFDVIEVPQP